MAFFNDKWFTNFMLSIIATLISIFSMVGIGFLKDLSSNVDVIGKWKAAQEVTTTSLQSEVNQARLDIIYLKGEVGDLKAQLKYSTKAQDVSGRQKRQLTYNASLFTCK